ncbi:MAG: UrcA family protein [Marinicaulis sp.]|nr:UrcA family protein [Marinicaulis sp.]
MTRLSLFATAASALLSGSALAGTAVRFDHDQLGDPSYVEEIREEIKTAAEKECRAEYRGEYGSAAKTRGCIRATTKVAEAKLDEAVEQKMIIASR